MGKHQYALAAPHRRRLHSPHVGEMMSDFEMYRLDETQRTKIISGRLRLSRLFPSQSTLLKAVPGKL